MALKNKNWFLVVSFKTELLTEYAIQHGFNYLPKLLGIKAIFKNRKNIDNDIFGLREEYAEFDEFVKKDYQHSIPKFFDVIEKTSEEFILFGKKLERECLYKISDKELFDVFKKYYSSYERAAGLIGIPAAIEFPMVVLLREKTAPWLASHKMPFDDFLQKISFSEHETKTIQERKDLLKIAVKMESGRNVDSLMNKHAKKYVWIHKTLFLGEDYSYERVKSEIVGLSKQKPGEKLKKLLLEKEKQRGELKKIIAQLPAGIRKDVALFQELVFFRNTRLEWLNEGCHCGYALIKEIANRISISFEQAIYSLPYELTDWLAGKNKPDIHELDKRIKKYALVMEDLKISLYTGEKVDKLMIKSRVDNDSELNGQVASRGFARGKARIVKDRSELGKVKQGDILITRLTTPDFVTAMEKAVAIVTDIGGLTSHAAIVSRELGIPCIIGTKVATKIFKDGDLIEVDADNGVVRRLGKHDDARLVDAHGLAGAAGSFDVAEIFCKDMQGFPVMKQEGNFSGLAFESIVPGLFPPYNDKYYDFDFGSLVSVLAPNYGAVFFNKTIYQSVTIAAYKHLQDKKAVDMLLEIKNFHLLEKEIFSAYDKYNPEFLAGLDDKKLESAIHSFFVFMHRFLACTVFCESMDEEMIKKLYCDAGNVSADTNEFDKFLSITTKAGVKSFATRYDEVLANDKMSDYERQWVLADYYEAPEITKVKSIIRQRVKSMGDKSEIKNKAAHAIFEVKQNITAMDAYFKKLDSKRRLLAEFIQLCINLRDTRKEAIQKTITLLSNTVREIFKRRGLELEKAPFSIASDFSTERYKQDDYADELERRYKGFSLYFNKDGLMLQYNDFDDVKKKLFSLLDKQSGSSDELKGSSACKGRVKARVKIVLGEKDFSNLKKGEILVTSMTRPEYLPLMKKASGIITDEGGLTCHAAIVARELGIPCIIGTDNATRMLKDGELVMLDADNGIVRRIKN